MRVSVTHWAKQHDGRGYPSESMISRAVVGGDRRAPTFQAPGAPAPPSGGAGVGPGGAGGCRGRTSFLVFPDRGVPESDLLVTIQEAPAFCLWLRCGGSLVEGVAKRFGGKVRAPFCVTSRGRPANASKQFSILDNPRVVLQLSDVGRGSSMLHHAIKQKLPWTPQVLGRLFVISLKLLTEHHWGFASQPRRPIAVFRPTIFCVDIEAVTSAARPGDR
jgi:hypothetical protein